MVSLRKKLNFGSHSSCTLVFENDNGVDTKVLVEDSSSGEQSLICWIGRENIESFSKDFEELLKKYFI